MIRARVGSSSATNLHKTKDDRIPSSTQSMSSLRDFLTKWRIPLVCTSLVLFFFGRLRYANYAETQRALDLTNPSIVSVQTKCATLRGGSGCSREVDRLLAYCTETVPRTSGGGGEEGQTKQSSNVFELHYVALTIRHGDRSAINSMPGSLPYFDPDNPDEVKREGIRGHPTYGHNYLDTRALAFVPQLQGFTVKPLYSPEQAANREAEIDTLRGALSPPASPIFQTPDLRLAPGLLTTRGFMQHVELGRALGRAYSGLLKGVHGAQNLKIRSTNYPRTIQSVAALVLGMAPDVGGSGDGESGDVPARQGAGVGRAGLEGFVPKRQLDGRVVIESHLLEEVEVMHGVGLKLSSQAAAGTGGEERVISGSCDKSVTLAQRQKEAFVLQPSVQARLETLFAPAAATAAATSAASATTSGAQTKSPHAASPIREKFVTELADAAIPHLCHNQELPCSAQGNGCVTEDLLGSLMSQADRAFCDRYMGAKGGLDATKLSIYPFLSEIVSSLRAQADAYDPPPFSATAIINNANSAAKAGSSSSSPKPHLNPHPKAAFSMLTEKHLKEALRVKMGIFSGHDTVIAPVLAGLGVYSGQDCIWPPYASRIAFELWRPAQPATTTGGQAQGKGQDGGDSSSTTSTSAGVGEGAVSLSANEATTPGGGLTSHDWHVRVVYNGKEVTAQIPTCQDEAKEKGSRSTSLTRMCSLDALERQVQGLLGGFASMKEACAAPVV